MPTPVGAPRLLLRRLREVMAERTERPAAPGQLVVVLIASNMVAEVCSIYLRRRDGSLELFATEGLKPRGRPQHPSEAGEGLVGLVASPAEPLQSLRRARTIPHSPTGRKRARRSIIPSSACRSCAAATGVRRAHGAEPHAAPLHRRRGRGAADRRHGAGRGGRPGRHLPPKMSAKATRAELGIRFEGVAISEGVALGHVVLHEPRVMVDR